MSEVLHNDPLAPGLADLSAVQRTIAFARFRQIQPFIEHGVPLTQLAPQHRISLRTARHGFDATACRDCKACAAKDAVTVIAPASCRPI